VLPHLPGFRPFSSLIICALLLSWLTACNAPTRTASWKYTDLKYLDPPGDGSPSQDLAAVYLRQVGNRLEFRLELIDVPFKPDYDLYLLLDSQPGGQSSWPVALQPPDGATPIAWEMFLRIKAQGGHAGFSRGEIPLSNLALRIDRNPTLDTIVVSLDRRRLQSSLSQLHFQVAVTPVGSPQIVDWTPPISSQDSPSARANILLAFSNSLPASTPAQALRSWDGAHSGPFGQRHGLQPLLQTLKHNQIPFVLLDMKTPEALAALDYMQGIPLLAELVSQGLAFLPQTALPTLGLGFADPNPQYLADSLASGRLFGLSPSPAAYLAYSDPANNLGEVAQKNQLLFIKSSRNEADTALELLTPQRLQQSLLLELPEPSPMQVDREGLSILSRRQLVTAALSTQGLAENGIYLLGGSLPQSTWGDLESGSQAAAYLRARPWIHPLTLSDLLSLHPVETFPGSVQPTSSPDNPAAKLSGDLPAEPSTLAATAPLAWSAYRDFSFEAGTAPAAYPQLVQSALWIPELLKIAEDWAVHPDQMSRCDQDLDQDGESECLLASSTTLAVIDPALSGLTLLGVRQKCEPAGFPHCSPFLELIGPSSQLALGLSDPSTWDFSRGPFADPAAVPGGFNQNNPTGITLLTPDQLVVSGDPVLIFTLLPDGIHISATFDSAGMSPGYQTRLPIVLDPLRRFSPDWQSRYAVHPISGGYQISWEGGPAVEIVFPGEISTNSFIDSPAAQLPQENPDLELPPGHFYPFPLSVLTFSLQENTTITIRLASPVATPPP
jgi:hypothetical protein